MKFLISRGVINRNVYQKFEYDATSPMSTMIVSFQHVASSTFR